MPLSGHFWLHHQQPTFCRLHSHSCRIQQQHIDVGKHHTSRRKQNVASHQRCQDGNAMYSKQKQVIGLSISNVALQQVESFIYLGGSRRVTTVHPKILYDIGIAMGVARSLQTIWKASNFMSNTKLLLYRSIHPSILLFNAETWCLKEEDKRKLRIFEMSVLRIIAGFSLRERRHTKSIREGLGMDADIVQLVQQRRLMYFEHIMRIDQNDVYLTSSCMYECMVRDHVKSKQEMA